MKEKLEIFLSESKNVIKICEKIKKAIEILKNEGEKNTIKILSYISKINKNKKGMKQLLGRLMKNIKISFIEKESAIKYDEYYFNGVPIPINIEFKDIATNKIKILWKIDDIKILNFDKNEIKYKIEIKKENTKDDFKFRKEKRVIVYLIN